MGFNSQLFNYPRGWNIIRIWSKHWWNNQDHEIQRIVDEVARIELKEGILILLRTKD